MNEQMLAPTDEIPIDGLVVQGQEDTALSAPATQMVALAQREIEAAVLLARRFPRDTSACFQALVRACRRPSFAERAQYRYPRGKKKTDSGEWVPNIIQGPSIYFAREVAKLWGNLKVDFQIVEDTDESRTIRARAWDLETNYSTAQEDTFKKLIQRKVDGVTQWVVPDERDLRELTNKRAAILERGVILRMLPDDIKADAIGEAEVTRKKDTAQDPDLARKKILVAFDAINVSSAELERLLGCKVGQASPAQIDSLRDLHVAIKDGHTTWQDVVSDAEEARLAKERAALEKSGLDGARAKS